MSVFILINPHDSVFWDAFGVSDGYSLLWYITMYLVGAYLNRFCKEKMKALKPAQLIVGAFFVFMLPMFKFLVEDVVAGRIPDVADYSNILYSYNSIPVVIASVTLFCVFSRIQIGNKTTKRWINRVAKTTLGVFIIHTHFALRDSLWVMLGSNKFVNSPYLWLHLCGCVIAVFAICGFLEFGRAKLFERLKIGEYTDVLCDKILKLFVREKINY